MNERQTGSDRPTALLTDLYELTMLDAYCRLGMEKTAVFEFYVRRLPEARNFLVAAGLEQVLDYLEHLSFTADEIEWLASTGRFSTTFLDRLKSFRFTGQVHAMPEGTVFFASEPVLRVVAPLPEAQLVESRIINLMQYQILVASKAARCRMAAPTAKLIDFSLRRAHGAEAACLCSRSSYIAGFDATATVEASRRFGIPGAGTMSQAFVQAHELELDAFRSFATCHPDNAVLLIDTYDTTQGARRAASLSRQLRSAGVRIKGVRIDSGELASDARRVRAILDAEGASDVQIFVSSGVDEYAIHEMQAQNVPVDGYCVGTRLAVSEDAPSLDCAYKLQQYAGRLCRKRSQWKESWPGPRQVFRQYDGRGLISLDHLCCADEVYEGCALLRPVMVNGRRTMDPRPLSEIRRYCADQLATLPDVSRSLQHCSSAPTKVSAKQHALVAEVDRIAH